MMASLHYQLMSSAFYLIRKKFVEMKSIDFSSVKLIGTLISVRTTYILLLFRRIVLFFSSSAI